MWQFILLFLTIVSTEAVETLGRYNVDPSSTTVSGISSGGAMAMQFHLAHSNDVKGAGIFAGGPYLCAYKSLISAATCMAAPELVDVSKLITNANELSTQGDIDPISNVNGSSVYIWHGKLDFVVRQASGKKVAEMYQQLGAKVTTEFTKWAAHGQPTDNYGGACGVISPLTSFCNNCNYNGAFEMLNTLYGDLIRPGKTLIYTGKIVEFDQKEFLNGLLGGVMADEAYLYVPSKCQDGVTQCRFHIAFHGCMTNKAWIKDAYITKTGYAQVADANNIIMLFPQVGAINPSACWDWVGYLGRQTYPTKKGDQVSAVYRMLQRIVKN